MNNHLLDQLKAVSERLKTPNWRAARRVLLITFAFYYAAVTFASEGRSEWILVLLLIFLYPYWAIFLLAFISDETNPMHSWRLWCAWFLITLPFIDNLVAKLSGREQPVLGIPYSTTFYYLTLGSPIVVFVGAFIGYLLWQVFCWLRNLRHDDHAQSSPST